MKYFSGNRKNEPYFEGWYFKHQKNEKIISLIPGIQIDDSGNMSSFIQVILNDISYYVNYPYHSFKAEENKLQVVIEDNLFTNQGIKVNINTDDLKISGNIQYGKLSPLRYDIMGPLKHLPILPCKHQIISMLHDLKGELTINGEFIDFSGGKGYIESDLGTSFPNNYFWTQCNAFTKKNCSITASVADIQILGKEFRGCFAIIFINGKELRLATYLGAKVAVFQNNVICIRQGKYTLYILPKLTSPQVLIAPDHGMMNRTILEDASSTVRYILYISGKKVMDMASKCASVEMEQI